LTPVPDAEAVGVFHQVKPGETLFSICKAYKADLQEVAEINDISDADKLQAGQKIFIPDVEAAATEEKPPLKSEKPEKKVAIQKWTGQFIWPVEGVLTSKFGIRGGRRHDGIDIGAPEGTEIRAAADGTVLYSGDQQTGYGNLIIISHAKEMITVYAHNQENLVKENDVVKRGQVIGKVGRTGRATGPHLHFEIRKRTKPRNPLFFLPKFP
jgi:murein DD-endopeptidase MepM/ murein hydrolase activator NlpD